MRRACICEAEVKEGHIVMKEEEDIYIYRVSQEECAILREGVP